MPEQQNIEYKQSWYDDYLKWVCGFANAVGGAISGKSGHKSKVMENQNLLKLKDLLLSKLATIEN